MAEDSPHGLNQALERNIAALTGRRRADQARAPLQARIADAVTRFTGSLAFVYLHLALVGLLVAVNVGALPGVPRRVLGTYASKRPAEQQRRWGFINGRN